MIGLLTREQQQQKLRGFSHVLSVGDTKTLGNGAIQMRQLSKAGLPASYNAEPRMEWMPHGCSIAIIQVDAVLIFYMSKFMLFDAILLTW